MTVTLTWGSVVTAAAVAAGVAALVTYFSKAVRWVDRQKRQDAELDAVKKHHDEDVSAIKSEQTILTYGILACLKGLKEQGCNGPVTEAIQKIEKHLNQKAHE